MVLWQLVKKKDDEFGSDISGIGDFNGDGIDDIIISSPTGLLGHKEFLYAPIKEQSFKIEDNGITD